MVFVVVIVVLVAFRKGLFWVVVFVKNGLAVAVVLDDELNYVPPDNGVGVILLTVFVRNGLD